MPEWIEGLSLRCATNLDVHKTLCMEWLMGNSTPAGFRFGGMLCHKDNDNITVSNYAASLNEKLNKNIPNSLSSFFIKEHTSNCRWHKSFDFSYKSPFCLSSLSSTQIWIEDTNGFISLRRGCWRYDRHSWVLRKKLYNFIDGLQSEARFGSHNNWMLA